MGEKGVKLKAESALDPLEDQLVPARAVMEPVSHARDRRRTGPRFLVDLSILLPGKDTLCHLEPLHHGLEFRQGAEVAEKFLAFIDRFKLKDCFSQFPHLFPSE